ncbi:phage tail protein [Bradyrhizobium sp. 31Argb]|uniref:phage tail protein n=1 Tax=Bradyrhizobium sp. 31Argb TaxID=3141247 RepID=UPI00374A5FA6
MAIFTALAGTLLAGTFLAGSAIATTLVAAGLAIAAEIGVSYALKAIAGNANQLANQTDSFGVQLKLQAGGAVPRHFPLGRSSTAGQLVYANYHGGWSGSPNAFLTQVIKLSDLPRCRLVGIFVNGVRCTIPGGELAGVGQTVAIPEFFKDRDPNYPGSTADHLWVTYYDGTQTTADPYLVSDVSSVDRPYESTRVGKGCAYVIVRALSNNNLWTSAPQCLFETSSIPLYDPSKDSTAGGNGPQRHSDPSTWGGDSDDLTAVQIYNILRGIYYEGTWVYGLQNMTSARLPSSNWPVQIQKCRDAINGANGPEPTYRSGGQINVDTQPMNAIKTYLMACQGRIAEIAGFFKIHLGEPDSPVFSFTDADIVSIEPQVYRPFQTLFSSVNGIQARYPDPDQAWAYVPAPAYYRTDLEVRAGNRRLMATPQFDVVPYPGQAQRLQKSAILEGQRARSHTLVMPPAFWIYEPGDVGAWTSERNGYDAKLFRIDGAVDKANLDAGMTITEVDPSDFHWDPGEYNPVTGGPTINPRPAPQGVVDWFAEGTSLFDADAIARRPAIRLAWNGDQADVSGIQYEIRLKADNSPVTRGGTEELRAGAIIVQQGILPNTLYQARGRYIPSSPRDTLWSDWLDAKTPDVRLSMRDFDDALRAMINSVEQFKAEEIKAAMNLIAGALANVAATGWLDKRELRSELSATAGGANAKIAILQQAMVDANQAFANFQTEVTADFGEVHASVTEQASAIATLNGQAAAQWAVTVDVNGNVVGINLINGGSGTSEFSVVVDKFVAAFPGVPGGARVPVFTIANVGGVPKIVFRGDMYGDGSITVPKLNVAFLSAISANLGNIIAGTLGSASGRYLLDLDNERELISD